MTIKDIPLYTYRVSGGRYLYYRNSSTVPPQLGTDTTSFHLGSFTFHRILNLKKKRMNVSFHPSELPTKVHVTIDSLTSITGRHAQDRDVYFSLPKLTGYHIPLVSARHYTKFLDSDFQSFLLYTRKM